MGVKPVSRNCFVKCKMLTMLKQNKTRTTFPSWTRCTSSAHGVTLKKQNMIAIYFLCLSYHFKKVTHWGKIFSHELTSLQKSFSHLIRRNEDPYLFFDCTNLVCFGWFCTFLVLLKSPWVAFVQACNLKRAFPFCTHKKTF